MNLLNERDGEIQIETERYRKRQKETDRDRVTESQRFIETEGQRG